METHILTDRGIIERPGALQAWIRAMAASGHRTARLDLGAVALPTSNLLVALGLAVREAGEADIRLVATNVRPRVHSALIGLGFAGTLEIEGS